MQSDLARRRERVAAAWALKNEIVLIGAGDPISIPGGADQTFPFFAHAEYLYLAGHEMPGAVLAFDPQAGWTDFVPETTVAERVWEGRPDAPGTPRSQLTAWIAARTGRRTANLGCPIPQVTSDADLTAALRESLLHARRPKDAGEIALLRRACAATTAGFAKARSCMRAGATEREIAIELEAEFFRHGAERTGYGTIVGTGSNSGVLHFAPSQRALQPGDAVLIDAGAECSRYTADVTRTYRVRGGDSGFFEDLYRVVLGIEETAIAGCRKGAEWRDLHLGACRGTVAGLVALGILRGEVDALVERDAHALFFPHGLGHLVGLGVRDASGYLPGRARSKRPGLDMLRTDLPLEPGYVITVEPGIYFIPAILTDPDRRAKYADCVDWAKVDGLLGFGGIRIEDDVLITDGDPDNLTAACPKSLTAALLDGV